MSSDSARQLRTNSSKPRLPLHPQPSAAHHDRTQPGPKKLAVYGGFAEVLATSARVLADGAELGTEINKEKAQARLAVAAKAADHITPDTDRQAAQDELLKAQAAVEAAA